MSELDKTLEGIRETYCPWYSMLAEDLRTMHALLAALEMCRRQRDWEVTGVMKSDEAKVQMADYDAVLLAKLEGGGE